MYAVREETTPPVPDGVDLIVPGDFDLDCTDLFEDYADLHRGTGPYDNGADIKFFTTLKS